MSRQVGINHHCFLHELAQVELSQHLGAALAVGETSHSLKKFVLLHLQKAQRSQHRHDLESTIETVECSWVFSEPVVLQDGLSVAWEHFELLELLGVGGECGQDD